MRSAYVLNYYDQAVFAPTDPPPSDVVPAKTETPVQKAAQVETLPR